MEIASENLFQNTKLFYYILSLFTRTNDLHKYDEKKNNR